MSKTNQFKPRLVKKSTEFCQNASFEAFESTVLKLLHLSHKSKITWQHSVMLQDHSFFKAHFGMFDVRFLYSHFSEKEAVITSHKTTLLKY